MVEDFTSVISPVAPSGDDRDQFISQATAGLDDTPSLHLKLTFKTDGCAELMNPFAHTKPCPVGWVIGTCFPDQLFVPNAYSIIQLREHAEGGGVYAVVMPGITSVKTQFTQIMMVKYGVGIKSIT